MKGIVFICARADSKGIKKKNIQLVNDEPLVSYTINAAKKFAKKQGFNVALSTDCDEVIKIAEHKGVLAEYKRPSHLGLDKTPKVEVWQDILNYYERKKGVQYEYMLDLDVSSPLRTSLDLEKAFSSFVNNPDANNLISVSSAKKSPYFNIVKFNGDYLEICINEGEYFTRQSAPEVFDCNASFYFMRRKFFINKYKTVLTPKTMAYVMPHLCFDIDEPIDLMFLSYLLKKKKIDFDI